MIRALKRCQRGHQCRAFLNLRQAATQPVDGCRVGEHPGNLTTSLALTLTRIGLSHRMLKHHQLIVIRDIGVRQISDPHHVTLALLRCASGAGRLATGIADHCTQNKIGQHTALAQLFIGRGVSVVDRDREIGANRSERSLDRLSCGAVLG